MHSLISETKLYWDRIMDNIFKDITLFTILVLDSDCNKDTHQNKQNILNNILETYDYTNNSYQW